MNSKTVDELKNIELSLAIKALVNKNKIKKTQNSFWRRLGSKAQLKHLENLVEEK